MSFLPEAVPTYHTQVWTLATMRLFMLQQCSCCKKLCTTG
jgi:hypothetical protein